MLLSSRSRGQSQTRPVVLRATGENLNTETGTAITLDCDIEGIANQMQFNVRWVKGNTLSDGTILLTEDTRITIQKFQSGSVPIRAVYRLTISNSVPGDTGTYTCQLVYTADDGLTFITDTKSVYVFVIDKFPVCSMTVNDRESFSNVSIQVNSIVKFLCQATLKNPSYSLQWYYTTVTERLNRIEGNTTRQDNFEQSTVTVQASEFYNESIFLCTIWNRVNARINSGCALGPLEIVGFPLSTAASPNESTSDTLTKRKLSSENSVSELRTENPLISKDSSDWTTQVTEGITPIPVATDQTVTSLSSISLASTEKVTGTPDAGGQGGETLHVVYTFPPFVWVVIAVGTIAFVLCCIVFVAILAKWSNKPETRVHSSATAEANHVNGNI